MARDVSCHPAVSFFQLRLTGVLFLLLNGYLGVSTWQKNFTEAASCRALSANQDAADAYEGALAESTFNPFIPHKYDVSVTDAHTAHTRSLLSSTDGPEAAIETEVKNRWHSLSTVPAMFFPLETVLPAYLLKLNQELLAALLSLVRRQVGADAAAHTGPRFWFLARKPPQEPLLRERQSFSSCCPFQNPGDTLGSVFECDFLARAALRALTEDAAQFLPFAKETGSAGPAVQVEQLLVEQVDGIVQQVVQDMVALTSLRELVLDFQSRLHRSLLVQEWLQKGIACLATLHSLSSKQSKNFQKSLSGANACASAEDPKCDDERRVSHLVSKKQLEDVQQAAADAAQLLITAFSRVILGRPWEREKTSPSWDVIFPYLAVLPASLAPRKAPEHVDHVTPTQLADTVPGDAVTNTTHTLPNQVKTPSFSGMAPRSLASVPALRGRALFKRDNHSHAQLEARQVSSSRITPDSAAFYTPRLSYHCFKRSPDGRRSGIRMTCECKPHEYKAEVTPVLETVLCPNITQTRPQRSPMPVVDQVLDCYLPAPEVAAHTKPAQRISRGMSLGIGKTLHGRVVSPVHEVPLQCQCFMPPMQCECTRCQSPETLPHTEMVRIVPEVVEYRPRLPQTFPSMEIVPPVSEVIDHRPLEAAVVSLERDLPSAEVQAHHVATSQAILVPCECIEQSARATTTTAVSGYEAKSISPVGSDFVVVPVECTQWAQPKEKPMVPCECVARSVSPERVTYVRTVQTGPSTTHYECVCPTDECYTYPAAHSEPLYVYDGMAE